MERPPYEIALMHDHILRLEEEIEQLKKENESLKAKLIEILGKTGLRQSEKEFYKQQIDQLKKELQTEKTWHKIANEIAKNNSECANQLKAENEALKNNDVFSIRLFKDKADKYKQVLTEIKEIVFPKNQLIITDSPIILKIQEKISEVIDER